MLKGFPLVQAPVWEYISCKLMFAVVREAGAFETGVLHPVIGCERNTGFVCIRLSRL
jgi:hypothetical protein